MADHESVTEPPALCFFSLVFFFFHFMSISRCDGVGHHSHPIPTRLMFFAGGLYVDFWFQDLIFVFPCYVCLMIL